MPGTVRAFLFAVPKTFRGALRPRPSCSPGLAYSFQIGISPNGIIATLLPSCGLRLGTPRTMIALGRTIGTKG